MKNVNVVAKRDHILTLTKSSPISALSELIWNGFDSGSDEVVVYVELNSMDGIEKIIIKDFGCGIVFEKVEQNFGNIGDSWKKEAKYNNNRALHGKNGKGRFTAFSLGSKVEWHTIYSNNVSKYKYEIHGNENDLQGFNIKEKIESDENRTGTEVIISNTHNASKYLLKDRVVQDLSKKFSVYLTEYPFLRLKYNGQIIDPKSLQTETKTYEISGDGLTAITENPIHLTIIEWCMATDRVLSFCDAKGISLHEEKLSRTIRAPGFNFTAYIKSDYFRELDSINSLTLGELDSSLKIIFDIATLKIKEHFRIRLAEKQSEIVSMWKKEEIYPFEEKLSLTPIEAMERQIFDIIAVNVQDFMPSFEKSDKKSKKFTFKLLAQAIANNPESVQNIISEVLGLKIEEQDKLASLMKKTSLSSIISSASVVADRLDFLQGLEDLIFDRNTKKTLLERDQLHKILEKESWLFHEDFYLSITEKRLDEVLEKHLGKLGERQDPVLLSDGRTGRIDLMLSKVSQVRENEFDYLVVELKRPSQKIDDSVITQIKKYAFAVSKDERFSDVPARWTFLAISNEMDDYAMREARQKDKPQGMIHDDSERNITVWVKTWSEVISTARSKLQFINKHLSYMADRDSSRAYLEDAYSEFLPKN